MRSRRGGRTGAAERGAILLSALVMLAITIGFTGVILILALDGRQVAEHGFDGVVASSAVDGATQAGTHAIVDAMRGFDTVPTSGVASVGGRSIPYTVLPVAGTRTETAASGIMTVYRQFEVRATATIGRARASAHRLVEIGETPTYQYAVFYEGQLEIMPGPTMTLNGRIHTNDDLTVCAWNSLFLDTDYVRAAGSIRRQHVDGVDRLGDVHARVAGTATFAPWPLALDSSSPTFTADALTTFNGTVQSAAHGQAVVGVPAASEKAPGGYYDQQAGLTIRDGRAYRPAAGGGTEEITSILPAGTLTSQNIYDAREQKTVTVTTVDMAKIAAFAPANGLIYAHRTDATPQAPNGIRLRYGATLPLPLTVVSPNPVYVHGDYNTVATKPASVICDALHLLSNAWNDTKTPGNLPNATNTTYNLAFVTGNVDNGVDYSGGFENLPRFHENWTNKTCTVAGSMNCHWPSAIGTAIQRGGGDTYRPPNRAWSFDTRFLTSGLPPFTPMAVRVAKTVYWVDR